MLRLVAYAPDGVRRFPLRRDELIIGSEPRCDVHLPYSGVAETHARLSYDGEQLTIEDLGSRRGTMVSGKRVKSTPLELLDEIKLGAVTLLVEDAVPERPAGEEDEPVEEEPEGPPEITAERLLDHLSHISEWVVSDLESRTTSEDLVTEVLEDFGGGVLVLLQGARPQLERAGIKLVVATEPSWLGAGEDLVAQLVEHAPVPWPEEGVAFEGTLAGEPAWVTAHGYEAVGRSYTMLAALRRFSPDQWSPQSAFKALGDLLILGLVHHVGSYEPILPGQVGRADLTLDPQLVMGPSDAMSRVLDDLRGAVDTDAQVLLRGEAGLAKERLARSLHISGPRRNGPLITATCDGASATQLEADLFGAEVRGKEGPVRRDGKIMLADGGTLFLDQVEELPLEVQGRLVRFLRSGEVEPAGSQTAQKVDVRLVAGSRGPLEEAVARDQFRVDLAYRLSQLTIQVPPLRRRREDLPLIIQSMVNRFCHETGKRMQGITVKAMSALLSYHYPGNLAELENIVRQLVYRCPSGQPVDVTHLPRNVRLSTVQEGGQVDGASELDLESLVAATETSAIREALRRTGGNKSQAARSLGLSRNGLAMKMERYGLKG